jgi:putative transposase
MVAAAIRTIFAQPDAERVREQLDTIAHMLGRQLPKVESMLRDAADGITSFADLAVPHWKRSGAPTRLRGSTRKSSGARMSSASSPTRPAALLRLAGFVLVEACAMRRCCFERRWETSSADPVAAGR